MEYQVPQFIEVENKIVGPLTLKQFIYIAGAAGLCVVFFAYLSIIFAILLSIPVIALSVMLAFYKVNGKPFIDVLEAGLHYYTGSKLLLWKHEESKSGKKSDAAAAAAAADAALNTANDTQKLTRGKLSELAWSLDVKGPESGVKSPE